MKYFPRLVITAFLAFLLMACQSQFKSRSNLNPDIEAEIDTLISKMTLEEKVGQMSQVSKFGEDGPGDIENQVRKGNVGILSKYCGARTAK